MESKRGARRRTGVHGADRKRCQARRAAHPPRSFYDGRHWTVNASNSAATGRLAGSLLEMAGGRPRKPWSSAVSRTALATFRQKIRRLTRRSGGSTIAQVTKKRRPCLLGWKACFNTAQTHRVLPRRGGRGATGHDSRRSGQDGLSSCGGSIPILRDPARAGPARQALEQYHRHRYRRRRSRRRSG